MDRIPADQLTVSLFREGYPQELFRSLEHYGLTVRRKYDGIYYVYGLYVPAQIVVTKELEGGKHRSLRILSRNATEEDIRGFVREAQTLTGQGERANVDAVLQVSVTANHRLYDEMKRRYPEMCEAMRTLMKDEITEAERLGETRGEIRARKEMALSLARMGMPLESIAEAAQTGVKVVQEWISE